MALQYPAVVPVGYAGTYAEFIQTKVDRSGAVRLITGQVTIPASTTTATLIGLFPFLPGFKLCYGSWFNIGAAGTSVTATLGYYFESSTLTSNTAAYLAASTTAAAGGVLTPNVVAGAIVDTIQTNTTTGGEGWVVSQIGGATTATTTTIITYNALISYDPSGITN